MKNLILILAGLLSASVALAKECSNEGLCVGDQIIYSGYYVTIAGLEPAGTYAVKWASGALSSSVPASQLARTSGCNRKDRVCVGEQYIYSGYYVTIAGLESAGNYAVKWSSGALSSGVLASQLARVSGQKYNTSATSINLNDMGGSLMDLAKISYSQKAQVFSQTSSLLEKFPTDQNSMSLTAMNNIAVSLLAINAIRPIVENSSSEIFTTQVVPEFSKQLSSLNSSNGITALTDIPYSASTKYTALSLMQIGLSAVKDTVSSGSGRTAIQYVIAKIGTAISSKNNNEIEAAVKAYQNYQSTLQELFVRPNTKDIMIMVDSVAQYLAAGV